MTRAMFRVSIPNDAVNPRVGHVLRQLHHVAGGATVQYGGGHWVNGVTGALVSEPVTIYDWCVDETNYSTVEALIRHTLTTVLFEVGQQAVLVQCFQQRGYTHNLYTKENSQ